MTNDTKQATVETRVDLDNGIVYFTFSNGRELTVRLWELRDNIRLQGLAHGIKQKIVDATAIARDPATGRSATVADKYEAAKAIFDRITSPEGTWNAIREGSGGNVGILVRAMIQFYANRGEAKTAEEIKTFLASKSSDEVAALRVNPKISTIITALQAKKVKDVDSDALLDELGGE